MINGENIICFGFAEWDNPYKTNQHHIMSRLSLNNKVLFIESLGLRQPVFQGRDLRRMVCRIVKFFKGPRRMSDNLFVYAPLVLPFHKFAMVRWFNRHFLKVQLSSVVKTLHLSDPVIWSYIPNAVDLLGIWKEKLSVYHCVDDLSANPRIDTKSLIEQEDRFLKRVSLVFTTAKALFEEKRKHNPHTYYLPNVADYEHFHKAVDTNLVLPADLAGIQSAIIGFIGAISDYKLDFSLIAAIASSHPEWCIVLVGVTGEGEKKADLSILFAYKNIRIVGGRPYSVLPAYLKAFDVCILPNKINDYTRNMFPMKFYEYLSAGKPVVSTPLPALSEHTDLYYLANNYDEFVKNIETALTESDSNLKERRFAAARKNTWDVRIQSMSEIIDSYRKGVPYAR